MKKSVSAKHVFVIAACFSLFCALSAAPAKSELSRT